MIKSFGGKPAAKIKASEKLPGLISTLIEEEKVIKEKYEILTLDAENENVSNEKYEMFTLAENASNETCDENEPADVEMEEIENVETEKHFKENSEAKKNEAVGRQKDSVFMETKIQELYSLLLQTGDEERIEKFQKFMLNQQT